MKAGSIVIQPDWQYKLTAGGAIALVNMVSAAGLLTWAHRSLTSWGWPGQVMASVALESISVYLQHLAFYAEVKLMPSFRLKLSSKLFGVLVGGLNASAFMVSGHLTKESVAIGTMSMSAPWLWGAYARQISHAKLMAAGALEGTALRLGATRWLWHPWRSGQVMYMATWIGESKPSKAIANWDAKQARKLELQESEKLQLELESRVNK